MHRAQPAASKLCDKRNKNRAYEIHMKKLRNMKSTINTKPPKKMPHLKRNLKKLQMEQENFEKIKYENQLLLNKMTDIMEKKYIDNENGSVKYIHSLNREARKRELMRITRENQAILKRIQRKQPVYNHMDWERDRQKNEEYIQNICEYPYQNTRTSLDFQRQSMQPRYSQYPADMHTMESYDQQQYEQQHFEDQYYQQQQQQQDQELLEEQNVDDLIDEVDKQLEQAGLRDEQEEFETQEEAAPESQEHTVDEGDETAENSASQGSNKVRLTILGAQQLKDDETPADIDPYVKIHLASASSLEPYDSFKPLETQSQADTVNPEFNETFVLTCDMKSDALIFSIYDSRSNELIETVTQELSELRYNDDIVIGLKNGGTFKFAISDEA